MAENAARHGLIIGLENEHACNIATGAETAKVLAAVNNPNLMVVWDPANAYVAGETPFPVGYRKMPAGRICHVHLKDCSLEGHRPIWGPLGTKDIDWKGQIAALRADGYKGWLSLETHWPGPAGDKFQASVICGWNLRGLSADGGPLLRRHRLGGPGGGSALRRRASGLRGDGRRGRESHLLTAPGALRRPGLESFQAKPIRLAGRSS